MRDAGHRTPDAGHRTSDGEKSKNNISTPQGGGHNNISTPQGGGHNNILISSQIGFELYQSHSLTVTGLKSSKKSKYWVFGSLLETSI